MKRAERQEGGEAGIGGDVFRVRVSLERYFSDERARCYMAAARGRPVRALARRLRRAFGLPRPFALLSRGHLLPPDEPLALLHPDDPIQVIPIKAESNVAGGGPTVDVSDVPPCSETALDRTDGAGEPALAESGEAGRAPSDSEQADLEECKRQALDLLQEYKAPRRRRRVRRRRTRAAPPYEESGPERRSPADEELVPERRSPADEELVPERRSPADEELVPERWSPVDEKLVPERRSPADEELVPERRSPADEELVPERRSPADEELVPERWSPVDEKLVPERRSPAGEELVPERRSPVDEKLVPERRSPADEELVQERRLPVDGESAPRGSAVLRIGSSSPRAARPVRPLPADTPAPLCHS